MILRTLVGLALIAALALGQSAPSTPAGSGYSAPGPGPIGPQFGYRLLRIGDVTGDGIPDYLVSKHTDSALVLFAGAIEVRDGANDALIWQRTGLLQQEYYGRNLGLADWDGDGILDIVAVAQLSGVTAARIEIVNATTGALMTTLAMPAGTATGDVGVSIAGRDLDFDGLDEIVLGTVPTPYLSTTNVGAPGQVVIFNSAAAPIVISSTESDFGRRVLVIDDADFDAVPDILATAPYADNVTAAGVYGSAGYIRLISTASLTTIWELRGPLPGAYLGRVVATIPDRDLDGVADLALLSSNTSGIGSPSNLTLVSAASATTIGFADLPAGTYPSNGMQIVGDLDLDGVPDLAVLSAQNQAPSNFVDIISLADFRLMDRLSAAAVLNGPLSAMAVMPDTNGDGNHEILSASALGYSGYGGLVREELRPVLSGLADGSPNHDLLQVNGSAQLPSRRVDFTIGQPFTIGVDPDPTTGGQPTDFIIWGLIGVPNAASAFTVSGGETFLFPPRIAAPGLPWLFCLSDSVGFDSAAAFPGFQAPWSIGAPFGIPFAIDLTFQGVTISGGNIDITNGILLHVR